MFIATFFLYAWYRMVMWLKSRQHTVREKTGPLYYFFIFVGVVGLICDVLFNWTYGTLLFLQIPREFTLSERLKRIHRYYDRRSYRYKLAHYVCKELLNPYDPDPDGHC